MPGAEYSITANLSCPVKAGPVNADFGEGLVKSAGIVVDKSGNALLKIELQSHKGSLFGRPYTAFVSCEEGQFLGYKGGSGRWAKAESVSRGEKLAGKTGSVPQVISFSIPIEGTPGEYSLGVYVNNATSPTQFGYNGTSETKYAATLHLDWSSLKQTKAPEGSSSDGSASGGGSDSGSGDGTGSGAGDNSGSSSGSNAGSGTGGNAGTGGSADSGTGGSSNSGSSDASGDASGSDAGPGANGNPSNQGSKSDGSDSTVAPSSGSSSNASGQSLLSTKSKRSTYSYQASFRKLSNFGTKSICDGLFSSSATVVVSGKLAKVTLYVIDPIPNFKQEGTPLSNVKFVYKGRAYAATYDSAHKVKKRFAANALFVASAGTYSATPISVVLPLDAIKASSTGGLKCEAYVRAVIKSTQGFCVSLSGGRLVSVTESKGDLKSSHSTASGVTAYSLPDSVQLGGEDAGGPLSTDGKSGVSEDSNLSGLGGVSALGSEEGSLFGAESNNGSSFSVATSTPVFVWVMLAAIGLFLSFCLVRFFVRKR